MGRVQVVMTGGSAGAASVAPAFSIAPGDVDATSIASIMLPIVRIDLKPADAPDSETAAEGGEASTSEAAEDESQWVRLDVPEGSMVDLMTLAPPEAGGEAVAEGTVVATEYKEIRLVCEGEATITLSEAVTLTGGVVIGDDEPLEQPLFIPSCEASGLKIKGGTFTVPADGEVVATIQLFTDATVQTIDWNSQGFRMDPVLKIEN